METAVDPGAVSERHRPIVGRTRVYIYSKHKDANIYTCCMCICTISPFSSPSEPCSLYMRLHKVQKKKESAVFVLTTQSNLYVTTFHSFILALTLCPRLWKKSCCFFSQPPHASPNTQRPSQTCVRLLRLLSTVCTERSGHAPAVCRLSIHLGKDTQRWHFLSAQGYKPGDLSATTRPAVN